MANVNYIFQINPYDINKLLPQVSKALEKRTELISREQLPGMWKLTDKFNAKTQGKTRNRLRTKIMSILCLALGIFLFVPGLMKPQELLVPLITGAAAIGAGIGGLWRNRKHRKNLFDKSARLLLNGTDGFSALQGGTVYFSDDGMIITSGNSSTAFVPYNDFECAIETMDTFLFVYGNHVIVLQKSDLMTNNIDEFDSFISIKIKKCHSITAI